MVPISFFVKPIHAHSKENKMLTVGDKFPSFDLKAVVSTDIKKAFAQVSERSDEGKWKVVFFWPKDFTFV